ncbi:hypothetical protein D9M69_668430 [compost metagenome]
MEAGRVETGRTGESQIAQRQHDNFGTARQGRHHPRDVLQQHGKRQRTQVAANAQRLQRLHQAIGHLPHGLRGQADPFGLAGGA